MKKVYVFATLLLMAGMAHADYLNTVQKGTYDLTANVKSGLNVWKNLPGGGVCEPQSGSMSYGGTLYYCVGTDGFPYTYSRQTHTWTKQTAMGTGMQALAVKNPRAIYGLFPAPTLCAYPDMVVEFWNGTSWNYTPSIGCLSQITVGGDGFIAGVNSMPSSGRHMWNSPDGGKTWNQWGDNYLHVHMWSQKSGCAVSSNGAVYTVSYGQSPESLGGNFVGCMYGDQPFVLMAWDASGNVSMVDEQNGAWDSVSGLKASHIAGFNKLMVVALDQTNKPYHWNFKARSITATASGTWTGGCPGPGSTCNATTHHQAKNVKAWFTSKHGINFNKPPAVSDVIWNQPINAQFTDVNPGCDPLFGVPTDVECQVESSGGEECMQSFAQIGNMPPPPAPDDELSHDYQNAVSYTNRLGPSLLWTSPTGVQDWYGSELLWMQDACGASLPTCDGPNPEGLDALAVGGFGGTTVEYVLDTYQSQNPWLSETPWDYSGPGGGTYCYTEERITWGTEGNFDDPNFVPTCD